MKTQSLMRKSKIYFIVLMIASTSCSVVVTADMTPIITPTSTHERLKLIEGEIDPCLLVNSEDVETVLGAKISSEPMFMAYMPSCKYISTDKDRAVLLIVSATTDVSIEKANQPWLKDGGASISAVEAYEGEKMAVSRLSEIYKFKELSDLGDQAFLYESTFLVISVLRNNIYYQFNGRTEYGVDYDALIKVVQIAFQRMP